MRDEADGGAAQNADAWPGDLYVLQEALEPEDRDHLVRLRRFMEARVAPVIDGHWAAETFPHELVAELGALDPVCRSYEGYGFAGRPHAADGWIAAEVTRVDPSMGTFVGVQGPLAAGSIYHCGSAAQRERWLPGLRTMEAVGAFGLTEPDVGSAISGGMGTTARREGDGWVLNGTKKWIGNASFADLTVIWARDEGDGEVKGFVVEKGTPGFSTEVRRNKIALRIVQNAQVRLDECRVPEENRLANAASFADAALVLRRARGLVAWQAAGCALGAFEHALAYARARRQFGRPIAAFQLVQRNLVEMLGAVTASLAMCARLSALVDADADTEEQASLAKVFCTDAARRTVALARETLGGNGILLEHKVGRFFADCEAIYSYEGSREMNTLIVGRAITGESAFV